MSDEQFNIRLLSQLHFVLGGVMALLSLIPANQIYNIYAMITGTSMAKVEPTPYAWVVLGMTVIMFIISCVLTIALLTAGDRLYSYSSYRFCMRVAYFERILVPLGTVLGILTHKILSKDATKNLFVSTEK